MASLCHGHFKEIHIFFFDGVGWGDLLGCNKRTLCLIYILRIYIGMENFHKITQV